MEAAQMSDEEKAQLKQPFIVYLKELAAELDEAGNATGEREIIFEKMEPLKKGQKPPPVDPVNGIFPNCVRTVKQLSAAARATATTSTRSSGATRRWSPWTRRTTCTCPRSCSRRTASTSS